ncbi:acetoin dehydrogenase (plasmid) [Azospirillum baldaniorum]|uniref:Pyruvate dehydrogenase E1 component, alpha subunit n=1 Tax=Azospirillum baldaniorum TaxID=1064539 RepID=A0A9P1JYA6_9PROT|nr:thiamine pyrophosphate-dependent dehydrogenase E1 component subunit alpha [Azospirillum baldaniorum]AWJ93917.1 acetoin dehydrogenase [Azospirillum baldaniorum]TWA81746.1 pyruvate dehydrogenase E1 component alpha subunit [Azospirillum brasilense]CCD02091.1 pyruvate dehydrogenase E1 component, alpha subunit [Azospirillum baldaniorum]
MALPSLPSDAAAPDAERLLGLYATMQRIRVFETLADEAHKAGQVAGYIHLSIGQEAIAAAVGANLRADDVLTSTHRGHGHTIAKGADPLAMFRELCGRAGGTCGGKGGSMHIADFSVGMLGANGVVAAGLPIAVGAAHAIALKGEDRIAVCFFGDGATNRGPFLEALNWAAAFRLPVLFVCEDNGYGATTRTGSVSAGGGPGVRAESLGIPVTVVDGNDLAAVDAAAAALVRAVRDGGGPQFLHARTYRFRGHTSSDPATYRDAAEVRAQLAGNDPLQRAAATLAELGVTPDALERVERHERETLAAALATALDSPWPDLRTAFTDVQDIGAPQ